MKIDHIALWVKDLEVMKDFYVYFFDAKSSDLYHNPTKLFSSYFLHFEGSDVRLELMHRPDIEAVLPNKGFGLGLAHFAISVGSKEKVDSKTQLLADHGYTVYGSPRITGDGYYESIVLDPEGNHIELTI